MEPCTLILGTVTRALAARRLLASSGIAARTVKISGMRSGGCAYALLVAAADMTAAIQVLEANKIPFEWSREGGG